MSLLDPSLFSPIFLHRNPNFEIVPNSDVFIYLFSIFWHISGNISYYYAGIMLDARASLLCSKLCRHNVDNPNYHTPQRLLHNKISLLYASWRNLLKNVNASSTCNMLSCFNLQQRSFNNFEVFGYDYPDETLFRVFDLASQTNQYLKRKLRWKLA